MRKKTKKKSDNTMITMLRKALEKCPSVKGGRDARLLDIAINRANAIDSVRQKVLALFSELVGERTARLKEPGAAETRKSLATEELCAGAQLLLVHAPNHLAAAAKLTGNPVEDIFEVGIFEDTDQWN